MKENDPAEVEEDANSVKCPSCQLNIKLPKQPLREDMHEIMKCQKCLKIMAPPIKHCINGHSICGRCRNLVKCPICDDRLLELSCITLNDLVEVKENCVASSVGCAFKPKLYEVETHEGTCNFNKRTICRMKDCKVDVVYALLERHISCHHRYNLTAHDLPISLKKRVKLNPWFLNEIIFTKDLQTGSLFEVHLKIIGNFLYVALIYNGDIKSFNKFEAILSFYGIDESFKITKTCKFMMCLTDVDIVTTHSMKLSKNLCKENFQTEYLNVDCLIIKTPSAVFN